MSRAPIDDGAESDQFMSLPGTPPASDSDDDDAYFWKGKSVHNYLCSGGLFLRRSLDSDPSPAPAHGSETFAGPSTPRDPANGEESHFDPSNGAHLLPLCQLNALRLNPLPPEIVIAFRQGNHHHLLRTPPVPSKECIAFSI